MIVECAFILQSLIQNVIEQLKQLFNTNEFKKGVISYVYLNKNRYKSVIQQLKIKQTPDVIGIGLT